MKRIKTFWAIALSLVMAITMLPVVENGVEEVKAASFAITSPANNELKPAGHIDIKWSAASGAVNHYELYVDNVKQGNTNNTTYDYYSTKVVSHTAYVKAVKNDGSSENSDTINFSVSKKGLGLASDMGRSISLKDMGVAWYYNWGENPSGGDQYKGVSYVPMVWKETNANNFKNRVNNAINKGYKEILTFNEPDLKGQCDMPVNDVYNVWQGIDNFNGNIRISSPVTAVWPKASGNWFQPFMSKLTGNDYKPDFISIHCYPDNYGGAGMARWFVEEVVDWTWNTYHVPIWITEFSTKGSVTATGGNGTKEFWETVMPLLDEREYVERYAGFCFNAANMPNCGLWNYNTGELTPGGEMYRDLGNPDGYDPGNLPEADYKTTIGQRNDLLDNNVTINGVACTDYISQGGVSATASSDRDNNVAGNVIDSDIGSRWESNWSDPQNLTIDLGSSKKIKEVDIVWEGASAAKYEIQVSNDGNNFTTVATVESNNGGRWDKTVLREQATGRYIRINGIARTTQYGYSIEDMAVYGSDNAQIDATTARPTTTKAPTTKAPTTQKPTSVSTKADLTEMNGALFTGYVASDKNEVAATFDVKPNGNTSINVSKAGKQYNTPQDALQAQYLNVPVTANANTTYSAKLTSSMDKKVTLVVTDGNGNAIATQKITLQGGAEKTVTLDFVPTSNKVHIFYQFANTGSEKLSTFKLNIKSHTITSEGGNTVVPEQTVTLSPQTKMNAPKPTVSKTSKKKSAKKLTIKLKKAYDVAGYQVRVYKTKSAAKKLKKHIFKKTINSNKAKFTIKSKKLKKKKLFVRVRSFVSDNGTKVYSKWSAVKKVKIK